MRSVVQRESSSSCYTKTSSIASVRSRSFGSFRVLRRCARTPLTIVVLESTPPTKRLKLAGAQQVGRNCVASPASLFFCRSTALRPRALRPQLKRDPLGCTDPSGVAHMRAITGIAVAIVLVRSACAQSHLDTVPFVGCPADGQQGYIAPPNAQPKVVRLHDVALQGIAYYKGDDAPGVFAPSGWHCRAWYGSSGTHLLVTAAPIDTTHFASRLFPRVLASFIQTVKDEHIASDSEFDPRPYARDSVRSLGPLAAEFTTSAGVSGLGTGGLLGPSSDPIHGVAVIAPDSTEPDMAILRVRLGGQARQVGAAVLRLNTACMQETAGC